PRSLFLSKYSSPPHTSPLSLHDALPILSTPRTSVSNNGTIARTWPSNRSQMVCMCSSCIARRLRTNSAQSSGDAGRAHADHLGRSEEHTSELQSRGHLVCRLLLEKKKKE